MRTIRIGTTLRVFLLLVAAAFIVACAGSGAALAPVGNDTGRPVADGEAQGAGEFPAASMAPAAPDEGGGSGGDGVGAPIDDAKIIRTGTIDLEVKDMTTALATARDGILAMGGYIGASQTWNDGDQPYASVTYRIPVERWEDALVLLRALNGQTSKVVAEQTQAVEVTGQVVDLEARIKNLQASESALQAIAAKAVRISDVLEVQNQLTQVRGEIESLQAQLKDLTERAAYATLAAQYNVPIVAVTAAQEDWDPATLVDEASASLVNVLQALTTAGIWFAIVWLPIILVIGIVVAFAAWIMRRTGVIGPRRPKGGEVVAG